MINKFAFFIILAGCFLWMQNQALAQWTPPPGNPPDGSAHLFINPMVEDLDLNSYRLFDHTNNNFVLDPGGSTAFRIDGTQWAGYFGKTYISELCLGGEGNCQTAWNADIFWRASGDGKGIYYRQSNPDHLGNVGINMVAPRYSLDVGKSYDNDTAIINIQDANNNVYTGLRLEIGSGSSASEKWFVGTANPDHALLFRASGSNVIRLSQTGVLNVMGGAGAHLYMYPPGGGEPGTGGNIELSDNATVDGVDISDYSDYFIDSGGTNGRVWTSDGAGRGYWGVAGGGGGGDGYIGLAGTHTAGGQLNMGNFNLNLDGEWLSGDGQDEGISIDANGTVILSGNLVSPTGAFVAGAISATSGNLQSFVSNSVNTVTLNVSGDEILTGRLGIGTNLPAHQLHLYRATGDNSELDIQSVAGAGNHWGIYQDRASADLYFWQGNNRVIFTNEGRVGIGTTAPGYDLDVNGTINAATSISATNANLTTQLRINRPANSDPIQLLGGTNPHTIRFDSQDLRFWTPNASEVMRLNKDTGNVGIANTNPNYKLDVTGSIHGTSYFSSDGSAGITRSINVGTCTITVKNGLITATTCP